MAKSLNKKEYAKAEYFRIRRNTKIFCPNSGSIIKMASLPEDTDVIKYSPKRIPKNSFCFYSDEKSKIAIAVFSIEGQLFITPAFFMEATKETLVEMGLKEEKFTPFAEGFIPYDIEWIRNYQRAYYKAQVAVREALANPTY